LSCGGGSTSGGVGTSTSGLYRGTISYSGYNTCGGNIPGRGSVEIVITSDGVLKFDPIGMAWKGGRIGYVEFGSAVSGSKISDSFTSNTSGYKYRIDGRIQDGGATVSGTGYIEGGYGSCYEKYQGSFAATRVG
jgi:hypothetical protein